MLDRSLITTHLDGLTNAYKIVAQVRKRISKKDTI